MSGLIQPILVGQVTPTGSSRFTQTSANLSVNGVLLDVSFVVPASYTTKWDFLKKVYLNVTLRLGSGNGGAVALISDVPLYSALSKSDFDAGVSMNSTSFVEGSVARVSGYLDLGFFKMQSRDALEVTITASEKPSFVVNYTISSVFEKEMLNLFRVYSSCKPTGADQPYKNVTELYYIGDVVVNKAVAITDQMGATSVNIEDSIAFANATGALEFFTRFGKVYEEPYNLSQDLTFRCPTDDPDATILICQFAFYPENLDSNTSDFAAKRASLIEQIRTGDPEKYAYLAELGLV